MYVQTVSDARQAYRNVTGIVRDTISEVARIQETASTTAASTTSAAAADGDQMMMAAGNSVENEIGGSSAAPPVDQQVAGQALGKLLGRNYRGLRRLFNSELRSAIKVGGELSSETAKYIVMLHDRIKNY